jgi:hypothetical protein
MPKLEVVNFDSANAQQDSQNLVTGCFECERRIETGAALLDKREVNPAVLAIA